MNATTKKRVREVLQREPRRKRLNIEFLFLDLDVCTRCHATNANLDEAIASVSQILKSTGVEVHVRKVHVRSLVQARKLGFVVSPTIRINSHDIQLDNKVSRCASCGVACGKDVDCRIWTYRWKEYENPPTALIVEAILRKAYGDTKEKPKQPLKIKDLSRTLPFFESKNRKSKNCCRQPTS
jgi:uncharacterized protein DUF2703